MSSLSTADQKLDQRFGGGGVGASSSTTTPSLPPGSGGALGKLDGLSERRLGVVLVVPALVLMAVVAAYPVLKAVWLSLHRYNIKIPDDQGFVGFSNYVRILSSPHWWETVQTTAIFTVASVGLEFTLGLVMALVMNRAIGGLQGPVRVGVLVPWATITVVTALSWKWMFTPAMGPFPLLLGGETCLLCGRWGAITAMILADVWKTAPFIALLLLAGLQTISSDMYEAADVDGATRWQKFVSITLPSLKPAIMVALLFRTLDAVRMFDLAYVMTGGANKTETISFLAYDLLIRRLDVGTGSAMSVLVFIIVLAIALFYVKVLGANPQEGK